MYILYIILVGLVAGWATGKIMKGSGYGVLTDILLGIAGAIVGSRLLGLFENLFYRLIQPAQPLLQPFPVQAFFSRRLRLDLCPVHRVEHKSH